MCATITRFILRKKIAILAVLATLTNIFGYVAPKAQISYEAVSLATGETGVSMIYKAIISFCGLGIFSASGFGGTATLGILISVTLLIAYCSNLVLLPCFLLSLEKKLTGRHFYRNHLLMYLMKKI